MQAMTNLTEADLRAAGCDEFAKRPKTEEEVAAEIERIAAAKPAHGPGIDNPPENLRGTLPDGSRWTWNVAWCPFHRAIYATFYVHTDGFPHDIALNIGGADVGRIRLAAGALIPELRGEP